MVDNLGEEEDLILCNMNLIKVFSPFFFLKFYLVLYCRPKVTFLGRFEFESLLTFSPPYRNTLRSQRTQSSHNTQNTHTHTPSSILSTTLTLYLYKVVVIIPHERIFLYRYGSGGFRFFWNTKYVRLLV